MTQIKAIETRYKGYRFRSRLEARWAVYFDAERLTWEYEPEGYVLDGGVYLPDFWLPQVQMYAEVKPARFSHEEMHKCEQLAAASGHGVLLLDGTPSPRSYFFYEPDGFLNDAVVSSYHDYPVTEGRFYCSTGAEYPDHAPKDWVQGMVEDLSVWAARGARFEHGEVPRA